MLITISPVTLSFLKGNRFVIDIVQVFHMDREVNSSGLGKLVMFLVERIQVVEVVSMLLVIPLDREHFSYYHILD